MAVPKAVSLLGAVEGVAALLVVALLTRWTVHGKSLELASCSRLFAALLAHRRLTVRSAVCKHVHHHQTQRQLHQR